MKRTIVDPTISSKRQRTHQTIPLDAWSIITSFMPIDQIPNYIDISKDIKHVMVVYLLEHPDFETFFRALETKKNTIITRFTTAVSDIVHAMINNNERPSVTPEKIISVMLPKVGKYFSSYMILLMFEKWEVDPSFDNNFAIRKACGIGCLEIVYFLLADKRVDPSAKNNYAIEHASGGGYLKVIKMLLKDQRVDPSADSNCAIGAAANNGFLEVVRLLLADKRVDPSANNNYAVKRAYCKRHTAIVKLLERDKRVRSLQI
jgi:hypothetical protein